MAKTYFIPYNVSDGQVSVVGQMVKRRNLIEGLCSGAAVFFLLYSLLPFKFNIKLVISFIISVFIAVFGLVGVNGDPVSIFIANWFRFMKNRRITYYNPRVKNETEPALLNIPKRDKSPLERIRLSKPKGKKEKNEPDFIPIAPVSPQVFEDDLGFVKAPDKYRTKAEKKELKRQKKQAKVRARNSKRIKIITSEKEEENIEKEN